MKYNRYLLLGLLVVGCGYKVNKVDKTLPQTIPTTDTKQASFSWISANILQPQCIRCHKSGEDDEVTLTTYEFVTREGIVVKGDPSRSKLYTEIESGNMPKRKPKLPDEQIEAVRLWIQNGAQND